MTLCPANLASYRWPTASIVYLSCCDEKAWLVSLIQPCYIQTELSGKLLQCDGQPAPAHTNHHVIATSLLMSYRGKEFKFMCRIVCNGAVHGDHQATVVRFSTHSQVIVVNDHIDMRGSRLFASFGYIAVPQVPDEGELELGRQVDRLSELLGLVTLFASDKSNTPPILLEDLIGTHSATALVLSIAQRFCLPVVAVPAAQACQQQLTKAYFTAAAHHDGCILLLEDIDSAVGNVSAASLDYDEKLLRNLLLQKLLSQHSPRLLVFATCSSQRPLMSQTVSLFQNTFTLQQKRSAVLMESCDAHPLDKLFGMADLLQTFDRTFLWPSQYAEIYNSFGLVGSAATGVMLCGPSGCGKSALPRFLSKRYSLSFLQMHPYDVIKSEVGSSEKAVKDIFQQAQRQAPSILFIDEFSSIFNSHNAGMTSCLLAGLDDIREWNQHGGKGATVLVVAACRDPDAVPSSCYLPGRFGKKIVMTAMASIARKEFLQTMLSSLCDDLRAGELSDERKSELLARHVETVDNMVAATDGCTAGDMRQLLRRTERCFRNEFHQDDGSDLGELLDKYVSVLKQTIVQSMQ